MLAVASRAIYESVFEAVYDGVRTPDLGGQVSTTEYTDEVIRRVRGKLEVWDALGEYRGSSDRDGWRIAGVH